MATAGACIERLQCETTAASGLDMTSVGCDQYFNIIARE